MRKEATVSGELPKTSQSGKNIREYWEGGDFNCRKYGAAEGYELPVPKALNGYCGTKSFRSNERLCCGDGYVSLKDIHIHNFNYEKSIFKPIDGHQ